jgi:hypothetical protein
MIGAVMTQTSAARAAEEIRFMVVNSSSPHKAARFPDDFMFEMTAAEVTNLISQFAMSSSGHGGRRHRPNRIRLDSPTDRTTCKRPQEKDRFQTDSDG